MASSDTVETAERCAKDAGAIVLCQICCDNYVRARDPYAESQTYNLATNQWKAEAPGFRGMDREEVMRAVKEVLEEANRECPSCGPWDA